MSRNRKDTRILTVGEVTNYGRSTCPMIRIQGLWLRDLGFDIGNTVMVICDDGKLTINNITTNTNVELMFASSPSA